MVSAIEGKVSGTLSGAGSKLRGQKEAEGASSLKWQAPNLRRDLEVGYFVSHIVDAICKVPTQQLLARLRLTPPFNHHQDLGMVASKEWQ